MTSQLLFSLVLLQVIALGALGQQLCARCNNFTDLKYPDVTMVFNNTINAAGCKEVTVTCVADRPDCDVRARIQDLDTNLFIKSNPGEGSVDGPGALVCQQNSPSSAVYKYEGKRAQFVCSANCENGGGSGGGGAVTIELTTEDPTTKMPAERGCKVQK